MVVDRRVYTFNTSDQTSSTRELVVDITLDSKDNKEEKTREGVDIRKYHYSLNFLQLRSDML